MTTFMSAEEAIRRMETTVEIPRRLPAPPPIPEAPPTGCLVIVEGIIVYAGMDVRRAVQAAELGAGVVLAVPVFHDARRAAEAAGFRPVLATPFADVPVPDAARGPDESPAQPVRGQQAVASGCMYHPDGYRCVACPAEIGRHAEPEGSWSYDRDPG